MEIPVQSKDGQRFYIDGEVYGIWTVAPTLVDHTRDAYTLAAYSVRDIYFGITVVCFTSKKVAQNFARELWDVYGDIHDAISRSNDNEENPDDKVLFDTIFERSKHKTRILKGQRIRFIPYYPRKSTK
jgi:hypothetical protein